MNKKHKFWNDHKSDTKKLGQVVFKKDAIGHIEALTQIKDTKFDLQSEISGITGSEIENYITSLEEIIESSVPNELRDYTIISVVIDSSLYDAVYNKDDLNLTAENYNVNDFKGKKAIEFTVNQYLNNISTKIDTDNENHCRFLKEMLDSMEMYYGVSLSKSIINLKAYDKKLSEYNNTLSKLTNIKSLTLIRVCVDCIMGDMTKPSVYEVFMAKEFVGSNSNLIHLGFNKKLSYEKLNEFKGDNAYKNNILFYKPIDAFYYNYNIPFVNERTGSKKVLDTENILDEYTTGFFSKGPNQDFISMQDGYILDLKKENNKYTWTYGDIRPFYIGTRGTSFHYQLFSGKISLINKSYPHKWFIGNYSNGKYDPDTESVLVKTSDGSQHIIRTVFFFLNDNENQPRFISSVKNNFTLNLLLNEDSVTLDDDDMVYQIPKGITVSEIPEDTYETIENLIKGIDAGNICFKVDKDELKLWTEPYKAGFKMHNEIKTFDIK
jgi:hypothetical protein